MKTAASRTALVAIAVLSLTLNGCSEQPGDEAPPTRDRKSVV